MVEEYTSIMKNDVWDIVTRLEGKLVVSSRWLYKIKHATNGSIKKFKPGLWQEGSLKEREWTTRRHSLQSPGTLPLSSYVLGFIYGMEDTLVDVKAAFLKGIIEEKVYIEQPRGFEVSRKEYHVCRLKKSPYGLKQAPRAWYSRMMNTNRIWASLKAKQILTYIIYLFKVICSFWCCM
jgi:hypothetical protein